MKMRLLAPAAIILAALALSYGLPKPKYQSLNILKQLSIPQDIAGWKGTDISGQFDLADDRYRFISDVFAHTYQHPSGPNLMLLILDAGNFHNPKVCFGSSGYSVKELPDTHIAAGGRSFKATTLLMSKGEENTVLIYWLCLDQQISSWTGQKVKEFWSSLFGKKKAGLMVRLDIPVPGRQTDLAIQAAQLFLTDLATNLAPEQITYIFGK